ncbi:LytTR family DNA-binding domain-containing protein [Streptococcus castoreus]|uniref:LytTR family DNA-binding domain-containing protein n=1 Tax=Streptococcus castoreus TaxID=254786 RepID=UPI000403B8D3|nr:LytTR family DNA-binding domain-containing protein [Streptococcus castoreus]
MKIVIDLDASCDGIEVAIKTAQLTEQVVQLQQLLRQMDRKPLIFYKGSSEYFLDLSDILFFETDGNKIFGHSKDNAYEVKLKLYELETYLPPSFCRVAKATIVNTSCIYSLEKSFSGTSRICLYNTNKQVHVSRHYYQLLKEKLREMR